MTRMSKAMALLALSATTMAPVAGAAQEEEGLLRSTFGYNIRNQVLPENVTEAQKALIADASVLGEAARGSTDPQGEGLRFAAMADYALFLLASQGLCGREDTGQSVTVWSSDCTDDQEASPLAGYEF